MNLIIQHEVLSIIYYSKEATQQQIKKYVDGIEYLLF